MESNRDDDITGMYELLDAIEGVIKAADPANAKPTRGPLTLGPTTSPRTFSGLSARRRQRS